MRLFIPPLLVILLSIPAFSGAKAQEKEWIFLNPEDSFATRYVTVLPEVAEGFLVLLPGFGEAPEMVFCETDIPELAAQKNILTIIPSLQDGIWSFGADSVSQETLCHIIADAQERYALKGKPFFVGGFSLGGTAALRYAQSAGGTPALLKPDFVFGIDPPLDFVRFYEAAQRRVRLAGKEASAEDRYMMTALENLTGGKPSQVPKVYYKLSAYSRADTTQQAVKALQNINLRLYTEPDVQWWLRERGSDFFGMNALDISCLVAELRAMGHKNVELITTSNKGYRKCKTGQRHPHSWSIAEAEELIRLLASFL